MKKVINGKLYNTETVERIAAWDNGLSNRDFGSCEEALYVTGKGAYFVAGEGGPLSRYARHIGSNETRGGEGLEVLTQAEALTWCEEHCVRADTIAKFFTVVEA